MACPICPHNTDRSCCPLYLFPERDAAVITHAISELFKAISSAPPGADNFGEKIEQKIFHAQIVVDTEKVANETKNYKPIPQIRCKF